MNFQQFNKMLADKKLIDRNFTKRSAGCCFLLSKMITIDEMKKRNPTGLDERKTLSFCDFLECICRVAELIWLSVNGSLDKPWAKHLRQHGGRGLSTKAILDARDEMPPLCVSRLRLALARSSAVAAQWLRSGCAVAAQWLRSGCAVAAQWLRSGCAVAAQWLRSCCAVAVGVGVGGVVACRPGVAARGGRRKQPALCHPLCYWP
jgi:hypothetical protein